MDFKIKVWFLKKKISGQNDEEFKGFLIHAKKGAEGDFYGEFTIPVRIS